MIAYLGTMEKRMDSETLAQLAIRDYLQRSGGFQDAEAEIMKGEGGTLAFSHNGFGKPYCPNLPQVEFSISHAGSFWGCLVGETPVGLDIENWKGRAIGAERCIAIAKRFFAADEVEYLEDEGLNETERKERFFWIWTRKEAYWKFMGRGLAGGLSRVSVLADPPDAMFGRIPMRADILISFCSAPGEAVKQVVML